MRTIKKLLAAVLIFVLTLSTYGIGIYADTYITNPIEEEGLFSGVVKENNPTLGYITLYFEDGSGANPDSFNDLITTRNFTYAYEVPVTRDGYLADIEQVMPGDKVFLKLDDDGYIEKVSAVSYYEPIYGTVHYMRTTFLILKKDDGRFTSYNLTEEVPVYKNNRLCKLSDILPGDKIRILVQSDGENIDIAGIDIEKMTRPITGIYRGEVELYNGINSSLAVSRVQEFVNGRWEVTSNIGVQSFPYSKEYKNLPPRRPSGMVYFATSKDYSGENKIVMTSFRGNSGYETTLNSNILNVNINGRLELKNRSTLLTYDENTIAVKDGRLVDVSAFNTLDPVKISMDKSLYRNEYLANVLVSDTNINTGVTIYRGRINNIEPQKTITVESFAMLDGVSWEFTNTPKTFDIDPFTSRLIEADGVGNLRNMGSNYIQQTVYIVADGTKILLVSTAPYADSPLAGRVKSAETNDIVSEAGEGIPQLKLKVSEVRTYDDTKHIWSEGADIEIDIPSNAIVVKNGKIGDLSSIKPGHEIKIIRHSQNKEGIIIMCE